MVQELVTVATFTTAMEAHLYKNMLEIEGVATFVTDELTGDFLSGAYIQGYVKLQVARQDAKRARKILDAHERKKGKA